MSLFEVILFLGGYRPKKTKKVLQRLKAMPTEEFRNYISRQRFEIFTFHRENNSFYSVILKDKKIDSWDDIPVITKSDFKQSDITILTSDLHWFNLKKGSTSGSSGTPLTYYKDKNTHGLTWQLIKIRYKNIGLDFGDKQARFYGIPKKGLHYFFERLKDFLMNRYRFVVFDLSDEAMNLFLEKFKRTRFKYVYGYTNSLLQFSKFLIKKNVVIKEVCPSIKCLIVTSEQCTNEDKLLLEEAFGVKVYNEYGSSEVDVIAFTSKQNKWILSNELIYVEVLDESGNVLPDGCVGRIVITHLYNRAMPIIRYEVGDYGSITRDLNGKEDCLIQLCGRLNDFAILPSGKKTPGFTFYYAAKEIIGHIKSIIEYQFRQVSINEFELHLVSEQSINVNDEILIKAILTKYLEADLVIRILRVDNIDREKSGKFKHFFVLPQNQRYTEIK